MLCGTSVLSDYSFTHILNSSKIRRILSRDMSSRSFWILSSKTPGPGTIYVLTRFLLNMKIWRSQPQTV